MNEFCRTRLVEFGGALYESLGGDNFNTIKIHLISASHNCGRVLNRVYTYLILISNGQNRNIVPGMASVDDLSTSA